MPHAASRYRTLLLLIFVHTFFSFVMVNSARVLFSLYALELGAEAFSIGTIGAMLYVLPLFLVWSVGMMFDRFGARWLLVFGGVCGFLGLLIPYFVRSVPALYAAGMLCGVAVAFSNVILQGLVGNISPPADRTRNFSNFSMVVACSTFVGPMLVGFTIDHGGHGVASLVLAVAPLIGTMIIVFKGGLLPAAMKVEPRKESPFESLRNPEIRRMLVVSSLMQFGIDLFQFYMPLYGHAIGISASAIGIVLAAYAAAAFVVRLVMPRLIERIGDEALLSWAFFMGGMFFLAVPFANGAAVLALISFAYGLCVGCGGPLTLMLIYSRSPAGRPGETLGMRLTANYLTRMVGPTLFGFFVSLAGLPPVFVLNALMMGVGGALSRPRAAKAPKS
jgi:MFS family permease